MKRILTLSLVFVFLFCFVACGNGDSSEPTSSVEDLSSEVVGYVLKGAIPELKFAIGASVDDLEDYYNDIESQIQSSHEDGEGHVHDEHDMYMNISSGELSVTYEIGTQKYYYEKSKKEKGISVICSLGDAMGFKQGTSRSDVEKRLSGIETTSLEAGEDELYFVPIAEALVLRYIDGDFQLDFYFNDNQLVATVLRNTKNWTI